jgi:hypothetical protein
MQLHTCESITLGDSSEEICTICKASLALPSYNDLAKAIERMREVALWYKAMPNGAQADCKSIAKVIEMVLKDLDGEK